jgi:WD40 repeat protein
MERTSPVFLVSIFVASLFLNAMPPNSRRATRWKTYNLVADGDVRACTFTPNGGRVALVYLTEHFLSEKPWNVIYTSHLAVWNFDTQNLEEKSKWEYTSTDQGDSWPIHPRYIEYSADGRYLVMLDEAELHVLDARTYAEVRRVTYEEPQQIPHDGWTTVGFSLAGDGSRAALAISSTIGGNGGFVRIYDLGTGQVVREWRLLDGVLYVTGVALSRDGERVAVSSLPVPRSSDPESFIPAGINNVRVMDVQIGKTITAVNTNYVAGPVVFGPNNTLLTASINDDRKGYSLDTIKVWDVSSGTLLREIENPHGGIHYRLNFSSDGKLLLGYTGTEKSVENFVTIDTQQFQIWDFTSGHLVAGSPTFGPNKDTVPEMRISPDGNHVVVWWGNGFAKPLVYAVPHP